MTVSSTITITTDELAEVGRRVLPFCSSEPFRAVLNHLIVEPTDAGPRWTGTDSYRLGSLLRGSADIDAPVLVPRPLVDFANRAASRMGVAEICFEIHDDAAEIVLALPALRVPRPLLVAEIPAIDSLLDQVPERAPAVVSLSAESLRAAVYACISFAAEVEHDGSKPVALRSVDDETLAVTATWAGSSDALAFLPMEADGRVDTLLNSAYLLSLLDAVADLDLTLFVGDAHDPLRVRTGDGFRGLLMPLRVGQFDLERVMADFLGLDQEDLIVDDDLAIPVQVDDTTVRVNLLRDTDPFGRGDLARFVALAAAGLETSAELLQEINDVNVAARLTRVVLIDGDVFVVAENLLSTLDPAEIDAVCTEVVRQVEAIGSLLEAVHR